MEFYRYEAIQYASKDADGEYCSPIFPSASLVCNRYDLIKETPKGYWIGFRSLRTDTDSLSKHYWKKWVSKTSRKRFAYPTKEEALVNYIKRTEKRIKILKNQILSSNLALGIAEGKLKKIKKWN